MIKRVEDFMKIKNEIIKQHQGLIQYYHEHSDEMADLMCETVEDYLRFDGFYYSTDGKVYIVYVNTDYEIKHYNIVRDLKEYQDYADMLGLDRDNPFYMDWLESVLIDLMQYEDVWLSGDSMRIDNLEEYTLIELNGIELYVK